MEIDTLQALGRPVEEARRAFLRLIEPHRPDLWRYCLRLTGSAWDAEDLVQETLMKAFARLTWWEPVDARPYLFRIASNTWIDGLRRQRIETLELDEGRAPAVFVYFRTDAHEKALGQLVTLETQADRITAMRIYSFTPEIVRYAGARLGVPACVWGYFHNF